MQVDVLVTVFQGCPEGVKVFRDTPAAEQALAKAKYDMGIQDGMEGESENSAELFYNVPVI